MKLHPFCVGLALILSGGTVATGQTVSPKTNLPGQVVRVEAGEFFLRGPDTISAGLSTFVLSQVGDRLTNRAKVIAENMAPATADNDPTRAFHMLWVVRLDSGRTVNEWYDAYLREERIEWTTKFGGPAAIDPPGTTNATMILTPGNYVLVCYVGSARADKNRHHVRKGMFKGLTVLPSSSFAGPLPAGDVTAAITGTGQVELEGTLRKGTQSVRVSNLTSKDYEFIIQRVNPGRTANEALTWRRTDGTDYPSTPVGGFSDVPAGETRLTTVELEPGTYVLWTTRSPATSMTVTIPGK